MEDVFAIMNLERYALYMRKVAAMSFSANYAENLDDYITVKQAEGIIVEHSMGKDAEGRYLIDEDAHDRLFESIKTRIYNSGLAKLAAKGLVECAWDDENNEMVFWTKGSEDQG
jgi:hypothetical protein